ncbi:Pre-Mrna 3' End Processing Protein Wdr33, partial [Manis pentadactyla]
RHDRGALGYTRRVTLRASDYPPRNVEEKRSERKTPEESFIRDLLEPRFSTAARQTQSFRRRAPERTAFPKSILVF